MQTQKNQFSDFIDLELISQRWNQISEETTTKDEQPKFPDELTKISQTSSSFQNKASSIEFKEQESKWEEIKPMLLTKPIIQKEIEKKTRNPFPQIIDEDTENFRIKLDHLINVFKNDALGEFMTMKKFLLENQVKTIKNETEKYLNMYEEKHIQVLLFSCDFLIKKYISWKKPMLH